MKLVLTLVARDEADIVEHQLRYHLERGVDFVVATDHRSTDGTTEILREHERAGHLHLIREQGEGFRQSAWVTRMARLAATEFEADWVINSDADEFWWPRAGSLKEVLAAVPGRFGAVRGLWRSFVPRPGPAGPFFEPMVVRRFPDPDPAALFHAQLKVAHRACPEVVVPRGNHDARAGGLVLLREWFPFEVLHFPVRSREHLMRKYVAAEAYRADVDPRIPRHTAAMAELVRRRGEAAYEELVVDDGRLERGLAHGTFALDTRLRDALRTNEAAPPPTLEDDAALAAEIDTVLEHDAAQRLPVRIERLEQRLAAAEGRGGR